MGWHWALHALDRGNLVPGTRVWPTRSHVPDGYVHSGSGGVEAVLDESCCLGLPGPLMAVAGREPDIYFSSVCHGTYESWISRSPTMSSTQSANAI